MKYLNYFSISLAIGMSLASCSDFLDADNKSNANQNASDYFAKNPETILPTAYNSLRSFGVQVDMHELGSDLYSNRKSGGDGTFAKFEVTVDDGTVKSYYSNAYKTINYANAMIYYGGEKGNLAEEARFIRGFAYYLLTQQFGGVPYVTHYIQDANREYPRASLDEIYSDVIKDLEDLYNNAETLPAQSHEGRASKQAVAALLAKLYLAKAWDIDTKLEDAKNGTYTVTAKENFQKAAQWSETAMNGVQLTMSFADKWSPYNEGNAEEIFSIQYERAGVPSDVNNSGHGLQNQYTAYWGDCKGTSLKPTKGGGNQTSEKSTRLFEKGDKRFDVTFMTTYYNAKMVTVEMSQWGTEGYYAYYNCTPEQQDKLLIAAKFFPYYTTEAEVEEWLAAHKSQTVKPEKGTYGTLIPFACIFDNDDIAYWDFQADGSTKKSTIDGNSFFNRGSGMNGLSVKKFDDPETSQAVANNGYRDIVMLHVSQMYLINAEAKYMMGDEAGALARLNEIRNRAGLPSLNSFADYQPQYDVPGNWTDRPLDLILDEYARECYAEQTRYIDLRRTKQLIRYNLAFNTNITSENSLKNMKGEYKWLRPIPQAEFDTNTALSSADQNPGY